MRVQHQELSFEDRRCEPRHEDLIDRAIIHFRGERHSVPVLNISTRGTMIECGLAPRLGETVLVEFPECSRIHAFVRWAEGGRTDPVIARSVATKQSSGCADVRCRGWIASLRSQ